MSEANANLKLEDILAARARIKGQLHHTPLLRSRQLSLRLGCDLYIKAEHLQKTGAFKPRGVLNFLTAREDLPKEVTTYSSGNHGQALAWGAALREKRATVFMPEDASPVKVAAVKAYGGKVVFAGLSSDDRRKACEEFAAGSGACIVPPFDDPNIIAGQGTVVLEVIEELPLFDAMLIPTGGGGLLSGNAFVLNALRRRTRVFACEPEAAADARDSLLSGELLRIGYPDTIADGVRNLSLGTRNWEIIRKCVAGGLVCAETDIVEAMTLYAAYLKQVVEPSGAVSLACLMANRKEFLNRKVVLVASGGNIALPEFAKMVGKHESPVA